MARLNRIVKLWQLVVRGSIIRQTVMNKARRKSGIADQGMKMGQHEHSFPDQSRVYNPDSGVWTLFCECGHSVEEEIL
jgi:hypothetical protein